MELAHSPKFEERNDREYLNSAIILRTNSFSHLSSEIIADIQKAKWVKQGRNGGFCTVGVC